MSRGTLRRNLTISAVGSSVPVGLCGRHTTTTRASAAASARPSRSLWPYLSRGTVTGFSRAMFAMIGYPSKVGDAMAIASPGTVKACSACSTTPVAPAPSTTWLAGRPIRPAIKLRSRSGRNSG